MFTRKNFRQVLSILILVTLLWSNGGLASTIPAKAMPLNPTDATKVPHYFGPYPNWANSPYTLPNATVTISGNGQGATASAVVGGNGTITGINIITPGSGYTSATISITGPGSGASADPVINPGGVVTAVNVTANGGGYKTPTVTISGGGAVTQATATAYGSVDTLTLTGFGSGYSMPTVDFDMPLDPNGIQAKAHVVCLEANCVPATPGSTVTITGIVLDFPGSGYNVAPSVVIRDGTIANPLNIREFSRAATARAQILEGNVLTPQAITPLATTIATAATTINVQEIKLDTFGSGYTGTPLVGITDATGGGSAATATAVTDIGAITGVTNLVGGLNYITAGGIKKFQDGLPTLCIPAAGQTFANCGNNNLGQHIPIAVADTTTFTGADYYVIALVQHREKMSSSLANGSLMRQYVQLETPANASFSKHVALQNEMLDGTMVNALMPNGTQAYAVDDPHYLGPVIVATKDKAVRIVFYNLLPTGVAGDLFLPVDTTLMGSGEGQMADPYDPSPTTGGTVMDAIRNPMCTDKYTNPSVRPECFTDNRATLHLHGGTTPWISDGTPHQWITPANESTAWPQGVSVSEVPDMVGASRPVGVPDCTDPRDGCQTFYYTNQQSARLLFYHDHAWGITRLNVYAGEAAGYLITDATDQKLFGATGLFPDLGTGIPLVIQDRTFVPGAAQLAEQDPTWDAARWGGEGNLWYHHVYMPAQNPGDPSGMSAYGRWMYGPWFWPPATDAKYGPIANPYFDPACSLDDPATWQYTTDPFCEPAQIPGTPNISVGMEQFNDTPIVNGTAYPTTTVAPKSYRFRILNAANDRFWNLQWYIADPRTGTDSEVALNPAEVEAAQTDPNVSPSAIQSYVDPISHLTVNLAGPDWIQIGTEGGFLPAPVVVDGQQVTTWITDPTRFDVGNVDQHSLLVAPAERADVIVDFSKFAGKTLILYNDAPAAFPARVSTYDYYTGAPDMSPVGAPSILPGYGPNTRTIMQVKVSNTAAAPAFNLNALKAAFLHHADGSGVFESGQHPIIVGQAAYNSAYGTTFAAGGNCSSPTTPAKCDGYARINQQGGDAFTFDTLRGATSGSWSKLSIPLEPKAIHDEMNSSTFDEFGRMQANLGIESVPSNPGGQNINLMPYVFPPTETIDGTNLPKGVTVTPIATATDGTQIWKITHNGVDTHPIHFHLYDVQVINRVTWDNIIIPPDPNELGWKDTVRISPLEDTIVALRPVIPNLPFEIPNSIRELSPMLPDGAPIMLATTLIAVGGGIPPSNGNGEPVDVYNHKINFGWEYVYHCHILSHEEMDMMRPVLLAVPPRAPDGLVVDLVTYVDGLFGTVQLSWSDNSIAETGYSIERQVVGGPWVEVGRVNLALEAPNTTGGRYSFTDTVNVSMTYQYRVVAINTVGDTHNYADPNINQIVSGGFPTSTAKSTPSNVVTPYTTPLVNANYIPWIRR
jgi:FtsP/CotA-like multicopper oxidase with cupredoxin domain